ncbi:hypothetical protein COU91_01920 [Candidatus Saccharibacteria bacterium CG10_big_fil_rev_8_21_14_0_10_47_8]|nr:MAG: hypothetical protein COU91_01920 [Candidatus Saccharibacteria bacterium CG10_big_fil_rev_8_21_14_0_10_47_8]
MKIVNCPAILGYMDSLQDILGKKNFTPPNEITAIRNYVQRRYKSRCYVKLQRDAVIISVRDSALAATIHLERQSLMDACGITRRLVIRTGSLN